MEERKLSKGNKISGSGAIIAFLCFFMPWVLVSCNDQPVATFNGWQLTFGGTVQTSFGPEPVSNSPILLLVLLAAVGTLALIYLVYRNRYTTRWPSRVMIGLATLSLLVMGLVFIGSKSQSAPQSGVNLQVQLQYGFWGVVLANIAIIVGALQNPRTTGDTSPVLDQVPQVPAVGVDASVLAAPPAPLPSDTIGQNEAD